MFAPRRHGWIFGPLTPSELILRNPGIPAEVWTAQAYARAWIYRAGGSAMSGTVFAIATWYLAGHRIDGIGGVVPVLTCLLWGGLAVCGIGTGLVAASLAKDEDRTVALSILAMNVVLLALAGLFLSTL